MASKKVKSLLSQGDRTPSERRREGIVPARPSSSSSYGLPDPCTAGGSGEAAPAKNIKVFTEQEGFPKPGPKSSKRHLQETQTEEVREKYLFGSQKEKEEHTEIDIIDSEDSGDTTVSESIKTVARKRGRPPNTGEYMGLAQAKKESAEAEERELRLQQEKQLIALTSQEFYDTMGLDVERATDEIRLNPTYELINRVRGLQKTVLRVSKTSRNLKGNFIKELKIAALYTTACVEELRNRAEAISDQGERVQLNEMRRKLADAEKEVKELSELREKLNNAEKRHEEVMIEMSKLRNELTNNREEKKTRWQKRVRQIEDSDSSSPERPGNINKKARRRSNSDSPKNKKGKVALKCRPRATSEMETEEGPSEDYAPPPDRRSQDNEEKTIWPKQKLDKRGPRIIDTQIMEGHKIVIKERVDPPPPLYTENTIKGGGNSAAELFEGLLPLLEGWLEKRVGPLLPTSKKEEERAARKLKEKSEFRDAPGRKQDTGTVRTTESAGEDVKWSKVVGRKEKKRAQRTTAESGKEETSNVKTPKGIRVNKIKEGEKFLIKEYGKEKRAVETVIKKRRMPRAAAVVLTCPPGQYAEAMKVAREKVNLEEVGVTAVRAKRAMTGALLLEIPGPNGAERASALREKMQKALEHMEGVKVARPVKMAELRIRNIPEACTENEIRRAIEEQGECLHTEVKVGALRKAYSGLCTVWASCPIAAANKIAAKGSIRIGWFLMRVELFAARPLLCYRCLEQGHVQVNCRSTVDRRGCCYRCGQQGHVAKDCNEPPNCVLCSEAGKPAAHRMGGVACVASKSNKLEKKRKRREAMSVVRGDPHPDPGQSTGPVPTQPKEERKQPAVRGDPSLQKARSPAPVRLNMQEEEEATMDVEREEVQHKIDEKANKLIMEVEKDQTAAIDKRVILISDPDPDGEFRSPTKKEQPREKRTTRGLARGMEEPPMEASHSRASE